ncbi:hypothetical protein ACQJBY_062417 [Aegilops geniculata]
MALAKAIVLLLCLIGTAGGALGGLCIPPPRSAARTPRLATSVLTPTTPRPSLDWRARGAVMPVMFQGQIGSCWAISSVGAIEGLHKIQTGRLVRLSSQQIFDCSIRSMANSDLKAFDWVIRNGGVPSEETYPYVGRVQDCKREKLHMISASIRSYKMDIRDKLDLLAAVSYKPVSVRMWLDPPSFYNYTGGIFTGHCGKQAHGMLLVGYGALADGREYWILKNSYGVHWGDQGYFYVQRCAYHLPGLCGLAFLVAEPE